MESQPLFSSASFEADEYDEGIVTAAAARDSLILDEERETDDNAVTKNSSQQTEPSVFGEISVFRDFFVAAFSDGYHTAACCGVNDYVVPSANCSPNDCYSSAKLPAVAPTTEGTPQTIRGHQIGRTTSSLSQNSNTIHSGSSHDGGGGRRKHRRKRPLAVAVGFKYAEDMHGRPVVITPGRVPRRLTVRQHHSSSGRSSSQSSSPASQPTNVMKAPDTMLTQLLLPLDLNVNANTPHQYKPNHADETRTASP